MDRGQGDKTKVGLNIKTLGMKNKTAPPQRVGTTPFYFADHPPFRQGMYDDVTTGVQHRPDL